MSKIAVVTDSSAGVPTDLARRVELSIVPISVQIDDQTYLEGIDLSKDEFYSQLGKARITTSQPAPGDFLTVYKKLAERAKEIISIHITSIGSGTINTANLAKDQVAAQVNVIDSETASMAQGFMALAAAKAALQDKSKEEILRIVEYVKERTAIFVAVPTLKYLTKSGRVSSVTSLIASMLSIKPILGVKDGIVEVIEKARTYPRALKRLISLVEERFPSEELCIAILHTNAPQMAEEFKLQVEKGLQHARIFIAEMSASLAVHGGQGMLGIAAFGDTPGTVPGLSLVCP